VIEKDTAMKHDSTLTAARTRRAVLLSWLAIGASVSLAAGCGGDDAGQVPSALSPTVVLDWSTHARSALQVETANQDPLVGTRTLAMVHLAMHDAVNAVDRRYQPYAYLARDAEADAVAAAATAAHKVLVGLFPAQQSNLDAKLVTSLAAVPDGDAETKGVALGQLVGNAILQRRANDGSTATVPYAPSAGAGRFQFVPPFDGVIFRAEWRLVTPFALTSVSQFRSGPPPALGSTAYRDAFNEVKAAGVLTGSNRTAEQTAYAKFWYEDSDIGWNSITRDAVVRKKLSLHDAARLFGLLNIALADAYIAGWDAKFHHDYWRPITAIRAAATDGNDATAPDLTWVPLLDTPPVQDHPSTHSVAGAAAAAVLGAVLGDATEFSFTSSTADDPKLARTYRRFSEASNENADSRIRAGIHFRFAVDAGLVMGKQVGDQTLGSQLRRVN
jgi:PAP2 superfamily